MRIFGHEIENKKLLIGGGVVAAIVVVVMVLRARAAAASASDQSAAQSAADQAAAAQGAGMSVAAPTSDVASDYQTQLQNAQLQSANIANQYQQQLMQQQQTAFNFQQGIQQAIAPSIEAEQTAQNSAQAHYYQTVANTKITCPGAQGVAQSVSGGLYCRQKTAGFLGIGQIGDAVQNALVGVETAAPTIGYNAANAAANFYLNPASAGFVGGNGGSSSYMPVSASPQTFPAPSISPVPLGPAYPSTPGIAPHGYQEIA